MCVGSCNDELSFIGGVRELRYINSYINSQQASRLKNQFLFYDDKIIAYYRFGKYYPFRDEYSHLEASYDEDVVTYQIDDIPQDICYPINEPRQFKIFLSNRDIETIGVDSRWSTKDKAWGYTASMWLKFDP